MKMSPLEKAILLLIEALPYIDPKDPVYSKQGQVRVRGFEIRIRNFIDKEDK